MLFLAYMYFREVMDQSPLWITLDLQASVSASYSLIPKFRVVVGLMKGYQNVAQRVQTHSHFIIKVYVSQEIKPNEADTSRNVLF